MPFPPAFRQCPVPYSSDKRPYGHDWEFLWKKLEKLWAFLFKRNKRPQQPAHIVQKEKR